MEFHFRFCLQTVLTKFRRLCNPLPYVLYSPLAGLGCSLFDSGELMIAVKQPLKLCTVLKVVVEHLYAKGCLVSLLETASALLLNAHVWASRGRKAVQVNLTTHVG